MGQKRPRVRCGHRGELHVCRDGLMGSPSPASDEIRLGPRGLPSPAPPPSQPEGSRSADVCNQSPEHQRPPFEGRMPWSARRTRSWMTARRTAKKFFRRSASTLLARSRRNQRGASVLRLKMRRSRCSMCSERAPLDRFDVLEVMLDGHQPHQVHPRHWTLRLPPASAAGDGCGQSDHHTMRPCPP